MTFKKLSIKIGVVAILLLVGISVSPRSAYAELPVIDAANLAVNSITSAATGALTTAFNVKEGVGGSGLGLDTVGWTVAKMAIQVMTKSIVNWINSGFNGSPAFVTDLEGHMRAVGDSIAGNFLTRLANDPSLKSPFQSKVIQTVGLAYYLSTAQNIDYSASGYTLKSVTPDDTAFLAGDFTKGGWQAWLSTVINPQNNPYGATIQLGDDLSVKVAAAKNNASVELNWGQGFLSWCGTDRSGSNSNANAPTNGIDQVVVTSAVNPAEVCQNKDGSPGFIQTPGSVIQNQVNKTLGLSGDQLVSADEFNEIIGALMSQLVSQVLGATGLSGVSSASSGGNGYIDQATNPSQYTDPLSANNEVSTLTQNVVTEIQQMDQYATDWEAIKTEAQLVTAKTSSCSIATDAITKAATEEARATTATTALRNMQTEITASAVNGGAPTTATIKAEYDALLANPATPTASDIAYASDQSKQTGGTLFTQLKQIATTGLCIPIL